MDHSKKLYRQLSVLFCLVLLCSANQNLFSQWGGGNKVHSDYFNKDYDFGETITYCLGSVKSDVIRVRDTHNVFEFSINGNPHAPGITNGWDSQWNYVTLDLQTIKDNNPGTITLSYRGKDWNIVIISPQKLTLNPFGTYCSNDAPFTLTGGSPAGGYYTVDGSTASTFDPAYYGAGSHDVQYKFYDGCTTPSPVQKIVVEPAPVITFNSINSDCIYTDPFTLTQAAATPEGGSGAYSGPGVSGNVFYPAVAGVGTHTITYTYKYGNCESSATQTIKVYDKPVVNFSGLDAAGYCNNGSPEPLTGNHVPDGSFTGLGIADNGNGTATFNPQSLTAGSNSTVTYTYADPATGCKNEISKTTSILPLPTAHISGTQTICSGNTTSLNVDFTGTGPFDFTYTDGVSNVTITNVNVNPYILSVSPTVTTSYSIVSVTQANGCSQTGTGQGSVTIIPQTEITTPLSDLTVCQGGTAVFNIKAKGDNISYLWKKNGVDVGTGDFLVLNNIDLSDNNSDIYCEVTSTCGGTVTSNHAKLYVNPKTQITAHPSNMHKCTGNGVTLSVSADGVNNSYRWEKDGVVINNIGGKISGATEANLTILNLNTSDAGTYVAYVSGDCGSENESNPASLIVDDPIIITAQPKSIKTCNGENEAFNITATGTNLSYQWYFDNGSGYVALGTDSPNLPVNNITPANTGSYYCTVSSPCGEKISSNTATLSIASTTTITSDPTGGTICEGDNFNFSVVATGDELTYEWYHNGTKLSDNSNVTNSSTANLTLKGVTDVYAGNYTVKVTGTCGIEWSNPAAVLTVKKLVNFDGQPANQIVCEGNDAVFSISVSGDVQSYQWERNIGVGFTAIPGANSANYIVPAAKTADQGNYRCLVTTTKCGSQYSTEVTLTVNQPTAITVQPTASRRACKGSNVSFSVAASGQALTYQWYKDDILQSGASYENATININNITESDAGSYVCHVKGTCGEEVISQPGTLTVDVPVIISNNPQSRSVCLNSPIQLSVALSSGSDPQFQWYLDTELDGTFISLAGETNQVLNIWSFTNANTGDYYCVVSNSCNTVQSQTARMTLSNVFTITSQPLSTGVCEKGTASFTITADQPDVTYQWMKNGVDIAGATSSSLVLNSVPLTDEGAKFSCTVANGCGTKISDVAILTVATPLSITQQPKDDIVCTNQPYSIVLVASGSNPSYQWYKKSSGIIAGATNSTLSFANFALADADIYYCIVTNGCGTVQSNNATLTAGEEITITDPPVLNLCENEDATFTVTATGTNPQYEWRKNDIPVTDDGRIVGSHSSSLTIKNIVAGDEGTYNVIVTGSCGLQKTSKGAYLDVTSKPEITVGPVAHTICKTQNASFSVTVKVNTGDPAPTYQWQKDGANINIASNPSAATSTLDITAPASGGIYRCIVTNACGSVTSTSAELIIENNVNISGQPLSLTQCAGNIATFTVNVTGPTNMLLQWYKDGTALTEDSRLNGVHLQTLTINNISAADKGSYWCEITSMCGNTVSNTATLTVHDKIFITQQPQSVTVCPNGTLNLSVVATGTIITYQWKHNGANVGGNSPILTVNPFIPGTDDGNYTCEMTNICGTVTSDVAVVTAGLTTSATASVSGSSSKCEGDDASFTVTATGNNLTYQWKKEGSDVNDMAGRINGSNSAALTISNLTTGDAGTYTCYVSGECGTITSNSVYLTVNGHVIITTQPASVNVCEGSNTSFNVVASGTNLSYQWYFNNGGGDVTVGTDNSSLAINNVSAANIGSYYCIVSCPCGETVKTNAASLIIPATTKITTEPAGTTICENDNYNFSVVATGDVLTYEWYKDGNKISDDAVISNSSTANLTLTKAAVSYSGNYTVKVNGTCGTASSSTAAVLVVKKAVTFDKQPVSQIVCEGNDATFFVNITGDLKSYQWERNTGSGFTTISGATDASYTITGPKAADQGNYRCLVSTTSCGNIYSTEATLTVNPPTAITTQPVPSRSACTGSNVTFSIAASGAALTYQWYKDGATLGAGYTGSAITINNITTADAGSYVCHVTGICGNEVVSQPGTLTVDLPVVISNNPKSQSVCINSFAQLTVTLSSGSNPQFQWYFDNELDGTFVPVAAGTTQILDINSFTAANAGDYYCLITNGCGAVKSQTAREILANTFNITQHPVSTGVCENGTTSFTIMADQPDVTYQWIKDGTDIAGETAPILVLNNVPLADNGTKYSCAVSNGCGTKISDVAVLAVSTPLSITQQPKDDIVCPGQPYSIILTASGSDLTYQWYKTSTGIIAGATKSGYSIANVAAADAGTYYCVVKNGCGTVTSNNATLTLGKEITITDPTALNLCEGEDATFTITATGTNPQYEWRKNDILITDDGRITGSNTNTLTIKNIVAGDEGTYNVVVTGNCGLYKTSAHAFLDVTIKPAITTGPVPQTVCNGQDAYFSVTVPVVSGDPDPSYQWQKNGTNINTASNPSAATSTLHITGATSFAEYRCIVTNSCGSITSTSAELIVEDNVNIGPITDVTQCAGTNATFTVNVTGPTNMKLQWYKDGVALTESAKTNGVNLSTLTINDIAGSDMGSYWCEIFSSCGNTQTNSAKLTVHDKIFITKQPQSITVCPNGILNLSVEATGTIITYQWKHNGVNVGTNSKTYTISSFAPGLDDGDYTCELSNICETVVSDIAVITAGTNTSAAISGDITACEGSNAILSVIATGSNLTYQWYKGSVLLTDDGSKIAGSQTGTLTINNLTSSDNGTYQCDVSGTCGYDNDNTAVLTVQNNIKINTEPASVSVLTGNTATFTVVASGSITGYQWYKGTTTLTDAAGEISGATTSTLNIINAQAGDAGTYMCVLTGSCGNVNSKSATLNVLATSVITKQPENPVTLCEGSSLSLYIETSGSGHTYQWKKDDNDLADGADITGSKTSSLTINNTTPSYTGAYTCVVDGVEISSASIVTINPTTVITANPAGGNKCSGDAHTFTLKANGANLTYQWYKNDLSNPIGPATTNEYTINPLAVTDGGTYFCVVTGTCGEKQSSGATLVVNDNTVVNTQPIAATTICQGATTTLTYDVSGSDLDYLWKKNGQPITDSNISGMTTSTLQISSGIPANSGDFTCTVKGACGGSVASEIAKVTVNPTTAITTQPIGRTKCEGDGVVFTVAASGSNLTYDWRINGTSLGLASNQTLTINNLVKATHEGTYTCLVKGDCGEVLSDPAVLTVNVNPSLTAPVIATNPLCENGSTTIAINATGDGLTYLWKKDGQPITGTNVSGITTNVLIISNALTTDAGTYTCTITGACGSQLTSDNAVLKVNPTTVITSQSSNFTKCAGDEVLFTIAADGSNLTYQWMKGGPAGTPLTNGLQPSGATISGATSSQLDITNITAAEDGSYTCIVTGTCGTVNTTPAVLTVNVPVLITTQPDALTSVCQGASTTITLNTSGTVVSYLWTKNGQPITDANISGITTDKLIISNATLVNSGIYSCKITGECNIINTQSAELKVNPVTLITKQPEGNTLCEGDNIQFSVTATGTEPLSYEWRKNNVAITGATASSFTINGITLPDAGAYTCIISGASTCGTATSDPANLTVNPKVNITSQPANATVCEGTAAIFSLNVTGTNLSYKWKFNGTYLSDDSRITGSATNKLNIANTTAADEGVYRCEVLSSCGTAESNSVTLTVDGSTIITTQPLSQSLLQGTTATFNVTATGKGLSFQWQKDNTDITGATSDAYSIANVQTTDAGSYKCIVSGNCGQVTSSTAILTVNLPVNITTPPSSQSVCAGETASLSVVATGTIVSYQWKFNGADVIDGSGISGAKTANLVISPANASHTGQYSCMVTGSNNVANSKEAALTVNIPVTITQQPLTQSKCYDDILVLEIAPDEPTAVYTWQFNGTPLSNGGRISGADRSKLVITGITDADAGSYRCTVSNICGTETSNPAVVSINPKIAITSQPSGMTQCEGQTALFSVVSNTINVNYQWYKNGNVLSDGVTVTGTKTANLKINGLQLDDQGSYSCLVYDNCTYENSNNVLLTVQKAIIIKTQPADGNKCVGDNHTFAVTADGTGLTYQWYKNDLSGIVTGATANEYTINPLAVTDAGTYFCVVTGTCGEKQSSGATLVVNNNTVINTQPKAATVICQGATTTLTFDVSGSDLAYLWKKNGQPITDANISGMTTSTLQISSGIPANSGDYTCTVTGACGGSVTSEIAKVTVNPTTAITTQPIGRTKCEGDGVVFTVAASGSNLTYDWRINGTSLGLPSSPALTINFLIKATHEGTYTCMVTGDCGAVLSDPAVLTVNMATAVGSPVFSINPVCENGSTTITVTAAGDGITYLWQKNGQPITGTNISGITTDKLIISNALESDGGVYSCTVTGPCGSPATSSNAVLTVYPTTLITTQPLSYTKCAGDAVIFTVATEGNNLTYSWRKGGSAGIPVANGVQGSGAEISGAATSQLVITGITSAEAGSYTCVITGTCGSVNSTPADLTVNIPAGITTEPPVLTAVCQGTSTSISVITTGTITSYRWKKDGNYLTNAGGVSGVNNSQLVISNTLLTDAGFYSCEITGPCNTISTQSAELRVNPTTIITLNPVSRTVCEGDNVQFILNATGTEPLAYQWRLNNAPIATATSNILTINNVTPSDAGAYTCDVSGASTCGTAISSPANLVVNPAINISNQPADITVCEDNTAILTLTATGTNLTYRWNYNGTDLTDDGRITGTSTNELNVASATYADEGIYKCQILSDCGTKESNSVVLSVTNSTGIITHPLSQTLLQGSTATFNVSATGSSLTYQWQKDNVDIPFATSNAYSIANVQPSDNGAYRCVVTGNCGQVISNIGILTVTQSVIITSQPVDQQVCTGQSAAFAVTATGTIVSYQWKFNGGDITDGGGISGAKTANLVISPAALANQGYYSCVVTGANNIANSTVAYLTVNTNIAISLQPVTQTKCDGDILVLEVAPNDPAFTYLWSFNGSNLTDGGRISGSASSRLIITGITNADEGSYRCTVSNICNSVTSDPAIVTINPVISITSNPLSLTRCEGQTAFFAVATSATTVSYQWYKDGNIISDNGRITGTNTPNLTINNLFASDQGSYSCNVYDACTSANSSSASLAITRIVVINTQPSNNEICEGESTFIEVSASGDDLAYQWQKNGANISDGGNITGTNSSILIIQNSTLADQGIYRCTVSNSCNSYLTNPATLTVNPLPGAATTITGTDFICQGSTNVQYTVPAISDAITYVWSLPYGATIISGAGTRSIQVNFSNTALSGVVSVHGLNYCGSGAESVAYPVTVNSIPAANAGTDKTLCANFTTFNANVTTFGTWTTLSGLATIANPNLPNSTVSNLGEGDNMFLWTVTENGCTAQDTVTITNNMVYVNAGPDQTVCSITSQLIGNTPVLGTGSWSVLSGGGTISNPFSPNSQVINLARGTNIFRWTINHNGCPSTDEVNVVNDLPTNASAGKDTVIIVNFYTLGGNNPIIGTGQWTLLSGSGTITSPTKYNTTVTGLGIGDNIFQWTITNNMCISQDEVKVTNYTPTLTDAGPAQTLCDNKTMLAGTVPNYGTGQWSVISGSGTFVNPNKYDTEVINIGKGLNTYRWTIYEYKVTYDDVVITNNSPSAANAGIDQALCQENTTLAGNNPVIGTGVWTITGGSGIITNTAQFNSQVTNLSPGLNTFKWTITNLGCSSSDEVIVSNGMPTDADAGVDQTLCADSVVLYPNTPTIGTAEWIIIQGSGLFKGNKVTNLSNGDNIFQWTIQNNGCVSADTVVITSNKPTQAYTGDDKAVCVDSVFLSGNTPVYGTGVWTKLSGSGITADVYDPRSKVTNLSYGQNRFRWTITYNGCTSFDDVTISYNYIRAKAGEDQTLCQPNALLNANDAGEGTGQWTIVGGSGSANFVNQSMANTNVTGLDRGINTLRWTISHAECVSSDDVVLINNTPSTAYAGADRSTCGEDIYMNANNPIVGTGLWSVLSGSATIENPSQYNSKISDLSLGLNVLRWTVSNQGCTSADEVVISNNKPTNIEAGQDQYLCSDSAQLYATAPVGGTGRWSIAEGSGKFEDNSLFNTKVFNLEKGENKMVWTVTIAGCSNSDTVLIVSNLPSTPSAGPDQDLCADYAYMAANQPLIGTGKWVIVSGSATFENISDPGTKVTGLGNGPNLLRWTITNGSCSLYDEVLIQNSLPTVAYAGEDRSVCNTTANLLASQPVSGIGSWSVVSGYGVFTNSRDFATTISDLGFGPNTLRWTTENGRCRTSDDVIITNNLASVYAGADQIVYSTTTTLVGNKPESGVGLWVITAGQGIIESPSNNETVVNGLGGGANTFSWTINNNGCISSDNVIVTYNKLPVIEFIPRPARGCAPLIVSFVNNSVGGSPFLWDFGDGTTSTATNIDHVYPNPGKYNVKLRGTGPDGIALYKDTVVIVEQIPEVNFEIANDTIYIPGQVAHFFNRTVGIDSLLWEFGDGETSNEIDPAHAYAEKGLYDVTLHAWTESKCYSSIVVPKAVFVDLAGIIKCPNAFTPNLNGPTGGYYNAYDFSNDAFHCFIEGVAEYHLEVYNRLGIILFESNDINIGWDGYFKGKLVEEGAYVYKIYGKFNNGESFSHIGNIILLH